MNMDTLKTKASTKTELIESSGNLFADLGLPNPELRQLKSDVACEIQAAIERKGITQKVASELMEIPASKVSNIVCGRLSGYTLDRLFMYLNKLDVDVNVKMRVKPEKREHAELRAI